MKKHSLIITDPTWDYTDRGHAGKRGVRYKYKVLSMQQMKDLNISKIAKKDSIMLMWCTPPMLQEGLVLMKHWGYKYSTIAFFWHKIFRNGKSFMGLGHSTRSNVEVVFLGKHGKGIKRKNAGVKQYIETIEKIQSTPEGHSKKPEEFYERVNALYGNVSKVELFATRKRKGWTTIGNKIDGKDIRKVLS